MTSEELKYMVMKNDSNELNLSVRAVRKTRSGGLVWRQRVRVKWA